jgi:hypothetical protein
MLIQGGAGVTPRSIPFYIRMGGIIPQILHVFSGEERNSPYIFPLYSTLGREEYFLVSHLEHMRSRKIHHILTYFLITPYCTVEREE